MGADVSAELRRIGVGAVKGGAVVTTVIDLIGVVCLAGFAWLVWPPAVLLVLACAAFLASWSVNRGGDDG